MKQTPRQLPIVKMVWLRHGFFSVESAPGGHIVATLERSRKLRDERREETLMVESCLAANLPLLDRMYEAERWVQQLIQDEHDLIHASIRRGYGVSDSPDLVWANQNLKLAKRELAKRNAVWAKNDGVQLKAKANIQAINDELRAMKLVRKEDAINQRFQRMINSLYAERAVVARVNLAEVDALGDTVQGNEDKALVLLQQEVKGRGWCGRKEQRHICWCSDWQQKRSRKAADKARTLARKALR